jgi:hypothetical protein
MGRAEAFALLLLLATTISAVQDFVVADEDLMKASPLTVAQCRAGCLHKVGGYLFYYSPYTVYRRSCWF